MTGYWSKSFDVGGRTRTAKVYISPGTPIRAYYTVIAVPDGTDTGDFLRSSGGAPVLEAWAVANPLKVIAQAYVDSVGLSPHNTTAEETPLLWDFLKH